MRFGDSSRPAPSMPESHTLPIGSLLLDLENPRLAQGPESQRDALHALLRAEGKKTLELAKDISERGPNPSERLMVVAAPDDSSRYVVLEGNRRLAALRLLAEPKQNGEGILKAPTLKRLEWWSREYQKHPTTSLDCSVFASRAEANPWIKLKHVGESDGAGPVRWGTIEQMRFDSRQNNVLHPELQILDFVAEHAELDDETREKLHDFPITNLQRLVDDGDVRKRLGVDIDAQNRVMTKYPQPEVLKGWTRVIREIANGSVKVAKIYTAAERKRYLDGFKSSELPDASKAAKSSRALVETSAPDGRASRSGTKAKRSQVKALRKGMASTKCKLEIGNPRIAKIFRELQLIRVDEFQNAASVLFRVFLELSTDHYAKMHRLQLAPGQNESLASKLSLVAGDLKKKGVLDANEIKSLAYSAGEKKLVGANIVTFHAYVHNKDFAPMGVDLRTYWDNLQHYFEKVWAK